MELHIYIDDSDMEPSRLEEIYEPISNEIAKWIGEKKNIVSLSATADSENLGDNKREQKLGLHIQIKSKHKLKDPLNFLYSIAKTYKCEFVIARVCPDSSDIEDICYFGYEEGRPDLFEIDNYLSL